MQDQSYQLTNLKYSRFENKLFAKFYGNEDLHEIKFTYSFYAKANEFKSGPMFSVEPSNKRFYFTGELVDKIVLNTDNFKLFETSPKNIREKLYLYDLSPEYQFLINNNIKFSSQYKVAYMDIETRDSLDAENAPAEVLMVTYLYQEDGKYKLKLFSLKDFSSEERMLTCALKFLTHGIFPDIVLGWNVIDYDRKYLMSRCKRLGVKFDWNRFSMVEFINGMDIIIKKFSYGILKKTGGMKLDNVAKYYLKRGKIPFDGMFGKLYDTDYEKAVKYNVRDLMLVKDLDIKLKLTAFLVNIQSISGVLLRDAFFNSVVIDLMLLNRYNKFVFPSRQTNQLEPEEDYEGGYVLMPPAGVFDNVVGYDVSSLYPSIILSFNLSPDSKVPVNEGDFTIDGVSFKKDPPGLFKETIKFLYDKRLILKGQLKDIKDTESDEYVNLDSLQLAYKTVLNSVYGVMAFRWFRLHDVDIAKTITWIGRDLIQFIKKECEEHNLGSGLYIDTDSLFLKYTEDPNKILAIINDVYIPKYLAKYNITENYIKMEIKDLYTRMAFFGKKKVYIGQVPGEEQLFFKGGFTERYDCPKTVRPMLYEIAKKLFNNESIDVLEYYNQIKKMKMDDLFMLKKMNKAPHEYKVIPQQLKALGYSKTVLGKDFDVQRSSLVRLVYVSCDKFPDINVLAVEDDTVLPETVKINHKRYFLQFLMNNMLDLYTVFGYDKIKNIDFIFNEFEFGDRFKKKYALVTEPKKKYDMLIKQCIKLSEE